MNTKAILGSAVAVTALGLILAAAWALITRAPEPAPHTAYIIDYSDSRTINCGNVATAIGELQRSAKLKKASRFFLFGTGDSSTSDEPVLLGSYEIPIKLRVLEGQSAAEAESGKFLETVQTRCRQEPVKTRSPIILAVKRVVDTLQANGCKPGTGCRLYVQTDGQELSETNLKQRLEGKGKSSDSAPVRISNNGIAVNVCGFAEVAKTPGRHNIDSSDRMIKVWKSIFTDPESVVFQPHCS